MFTHRLARLASHVVPTASEEHDDQANLYSVRAPFLSSLLSLLRKPRLRLRRRLAPALTCRSQEAGEAMEYKTPPKTSTKRDFPNVKTIGIVGGGVMLLLASVVQLAHWTKYSKAWALSSYKNFEGTAAEREGLEMDNGVHQRA